MLKCPFCHFENEDGALFCEQCKSDLAGAEPAAAAPAVPVLEVPNALEAEQYAPLTAPYPEELAADPVPLAAITPIDSTSAPMAAPMAEFASAPNTPDASPAASELSPLDSAGLIHAVASEATIAEPAAITMPASAIPSPGSLAPAAADTATLAPDAQPRLLVLRGQKRNVEYPIYDGLNFIGRADEKPVDIDLEDQEPPDRIWCSRQHALISFEEHHLTIEDLNSANGTFVNRSRIYPGQKRPLNVNDVIQIGNVQLKVIV
jgi:hypothetical protein